MADQIGQPEQPISSQKARMDIDNYIQSFSEDAIHYNFFSALRLFESLNQSRFGESKTPKEDPVLLGQLPHIGFAPTALAGSSQLEKTKHKQLDVFFFGLLGPNGALPFHLTEQIYTKLPKEEQKQTREFFNIFHHRLISLFYRAWANKEPTAQLDVNNADRFQFYVSSLAGYGLPALKNRDDVADYAKTHFSGYLGGKIRHKEGLKNIIYQLYKIQSNIIEFIGEWLTIPTEHQCKLTENHYARQLGKNTTLGKHSWQSQYKFQIQLGPLSLKEYESCLPGTKKLKQINETIRNYMRDEIQWEIILFLTKKEIPNTKIGSYGQLGWTSWLMPSTLPSRPLKLPKSDKNYVGDIRLNCEQI